jgi:hypothetical protein
MRREARRPYLVCSMLTIFKLKASVSYDSEEKAIRRGSKTRSRQTVTLLTDLMPAQPVVCPHIRYGHPKLASHASPLHPSAHRIGPRDF